MNQLILEKIKKRQTLPFYVAKVAKKILILKEDNKLIGFYREDQSKLIQVLTGKLNKKPVAFFNNKFGNVNSFSIENILNQKIDNEIVTCIKEPENITNLFGKVKDIYQNQELDYVMISDDYYKIKLLRLSNPQKIINIFSFRKFYMLKFIQFQNESIMIFDDGKIFITNIKLDNLNDDITDKDLVNCSKELLKDNESADYIYQFNDNQILLLYYTEYNEKFSLLIRVVEYDEDLKKLNLKCTKEYCNLSSKFNFVWNKKLLIIDNLTAELEQLIFYGQ